jgi:drug/metabolite transporter (DMT)-like permease
MSEASNNLRGAALMSAAMASFTLNDACMKALSDELPLMQALFLRGVFTCAVLYVLARAMGGFRLDLARRDWGVVALRTVAEIGAAYFFITALFNMPLANVTAILQSLPLTIPLAAALFLGEPLGWRRLAAIAVGMGGVLLIVRPGAEGFTLYSLYALLSVACVTVRDLATRRIGPGVPSLTVALAAAVGVTIFGITGSVAEGWAPVGLAAALQLAGATLFVTLGYLCSVMVMRTGELGFVAPFRYTSLIWALVLGLVVFGDWPDLLTLAGATVVTATGLFTLYRERLAAQRHRRRKNAEGLAG